jgi:hypothetical protein
MMNAGIGEEGADRVHPFAERLVGTTMLLDRHGGDVSADANADHAMRDAREDTTRDARADASAACSSCRGDVGVDADADHTI